MFAPMHALVQMVFVMSSASNVIAMKDSVETIALFEFAFMAAMSQMVDASTGPATVLPTLVEPIAALKIVPTAAHFTENVTAMLTVATANQAGLDMIAVSRPAPSLTIVTTMVYATMAPASATRDMKEVTAPRSLGSRKGAPNHAFHNA